MTLTESVLWPVSVLYGAAGRLRAWSYDAGILTQKRLRGIVVSVGNITTGGTGKTPMVAWLAQRFLESGKKVGVLSRGYRPLRTHSGLHDEAAQGWNDEVALLHGRFGKSVEFGIGTNRLEKGRELETRGVDCFILDDGFQHLQLARDVNIAMIDATKPFGGGHLLPSGRLREPVSALRRADIVVIHRAESAPAINARIRRYSSAITYFSQAKLLGIEANRAPTNGGVEAKPKNFFAFCGIGNPSAFFDDLKSWGISIVGYATFRDHHRYSAQDVARLEAQAAATGAESLLCTEKDIYDMPHGVVAKIPLCFCRIALQFNDEEVLWRSILSLAERKMRASKE